MGLDAGGEAAVKPTGTLKLVDKATRVVEVLGPLPPGGLRPKLLLDGYGDPIPFEIKAFCFQMKDRTARFLIDKGYAGDQFLAMLDKYARAKARPCRATVWMAGWVVRV